MQDLVQAVSLSDILPKHRANTVVYFLAQDRYYRQHVKKLNTINNFRPDLLNLQYTLLEVASVLCHNIYIGQGTEASAKMTEQISF
jgi:hypothetical protein